MPAPVQDVKADDQPLSARLWAGIDDIYAAILEHPFIAGLTDGSLDSVAFRFYVVQDAHYLREYARALSVAAARAPTEADIAMFGSTPPAQSPWSARCTRPSSRTSA
jgi:hypothetical protein